jgi:hypothetical protein
MVKRTSLVLFSMTLVAFLLLLGAYRADAGDGVCVAGGAEERSYNCFSAGGYVVEFDGVTDGNTKFNYSLTAVSTSKNVSIIDLLIPVCEPPILVSTGDPNGWSQSCDGCGGGSTGWGNVAGFTVAEQSFDSNVFYFRSADPAGIDRTAIGIKIGNQIYSGSINGPSCTTPLETTCKDVTSNVDGSCVRICFEGGSIASATKFASGVCADSGGEALNVYKPSAGDPNLVLCAPCGGGGQPNCPSNQNSSTTPYKQTISGTSYKCDYFLYTEEDLTVALDQDPCFRKADGSYSCW